MKYKNHQALKWIEDGKHVLECDSWWTKGKKSEKPSDTKQGKDDRGGLEPCFDFFDLRLVLHVSGSHHLSNHQNKHYDVNLWRDNLVNLFQTIKRKALDQ